MKPRVLPFDFLLPAFAPHTPRVSSRCFSCSSHRSSRVGSLPLSIPNDVTVTLIHPDTKAVAASRLQPPRIVKVQGPLGKLSLPLESYLYFDQSVEDRRVKLGIVEDAEGKQRAMWGTTRAVLQNHILGVSEGHTAILRLVGVGYRAAIEPKSTSKQPSYPGQKFMMLRLGYANTIELGVPEGVTATTPAPTRILLHGPDRETVMSFAATIRRWRKPEPYKGKGIFVNGETITLKAKKIK